MLLDNIEWYNHGPFHAFQQKLIMLTLAFSTLWATKLTIFLLNFSLTFHFSVKLLPETVLVCIVCVEVLRPRQPNGVMSSAGSLPKHTFTGQA